MEALGDIRLPTFKLACLQSCPNRITALRRQEPGGGSEVVCRVRGQLRQDSLRIASINGKLQTLGVQQVELRRLHVASPLARDTGEVVHVVLEVNRFESHGAEYRGGFTGSCDAVGVKCLVDERRGFGGRLAFRGKLGTGAGARFRSDVEERAGHAFGDG